MQGLSGLASAATGPEIANAVHGAAPDRFREVEVSLNYQSLRKWMTAASPAEQNELAKRAGTTRNYLYQLSGGHRTASAELAGTIEIASIALRLKNAALPLIDRMSLCAACAACPYAKKCRRKG